MSENRESPAKPLLSRGATILAIVLLGLAACGRSRPADHGPKTKPVPKGVPTAEQRRDIERQLLEGFHQAGIGGMKKVVAVWDREPTASPESLMLRCAALTKFDLHAEAERYCEAAIRSQPRDLDVVLSALCSRAQSRARSADAAGARADWRKALETAPSGWERRSEVQQSLEDLGYHAAGPAKTGGG